MRQWCMQHLVHANPVASCPESRLHAVLVAKQCLDKHSWAERAHPGHDILEAWHRPCVCFRRHHGSEQHAGVISWHLELVKQDETA